MADLSPYQPVPGNPDYLGKIQALIELLDGFLDEIEAGRQGQAGLAANFSRYMLTGAALTVNLNLGGFKAVNSAAPTGAGDLVNKDYADQLAFSAALPAQAGKAGRVARTNGTGTTWTEWWGTPVATAGAASLTDRTAYHIDSSAGPFSLALPPATAGGWVVLRDVGRACAANNVTLIPTGSDHVYGGSQNYVMNRDGEALLLVVDAVKGWVRA